MLSERFVLSDTQWALMEPHCFGKKSDPGRTGGDSRFFMETVLWIAQTGAPWRDLPSEFGNWNTTFKRFRHWVKADVFKRIFDAVSGDSDMECVMTPSWQIASQSPVRQWMAQSAKFTATGRAQKGDSKPGYRALSRWHYHQNSRPD